MDSNSEAIILLAWTRILGLDDDSLASGPTGRLSRAKADSGVVSFVQILDRSVLLGPQWAIDAAESIDDSGLSEISTLLRISADHGGRALGGALLGYTDTYIDRADLELATVTNNPQAVVDLEKSCPPDDVSEVGLAELSAQFVLISELDEPVAGAGFDVRGGFLAQMGVLTAFQRRKAGHGAVISALATNAALDEGLIPQWRSRVGHDASRSLARRLGYIELGRQTTVLLSSTSAQ